MPLGRFGSKKQSKNAKRRFEHLMVMAKENPDRIFDLSDCELHEVPNLMFSQCRVLLTESLLLHSNLLKSLKHGGKMSCLTSLRVLDLHNNRIALLPKDIGVLSNLQVFNIENNRITELPDSIGDLKKLQSLLAKDNQLNSLPTTISGMESLRTLDISGTNKVLYLPKTLCKVRTLEVFVLSNPAVMEYPHSMVACEGLEAIQKFICKDTGIEYIPPSHATLKVLDSSATTSSSSKQTAAANLQLYQSSMDQYQRSKDEKMKQQLEIERSIAEQQREQAYLTAKAKHEKAKENAFLKQEQAVFDRSISEQQKKTEIERQEMMKTLTQVEEEASRLVNKLVSMNIGAKQREEMLEGMERERMEQEERFKVTQEDIDKLRKKETLAAMQSVLADNAHYAIAIKKYLGEQYHMTRQAQQTLGADNELIEHELKRQQWNQGVLVDQILHEESLQKEAFIMLKLQHDAVQARLVDQIGQLQGELIRLTQIEAQRNKHRIDQDKQTLSLIRNELTDLLIQLLKEKDHREEMVKSRLVEMEQQREDDQVDFWLVQYQKLLDTKPEVLVQKEHGVDPQIVRLLQRSDAAHHLSAFARHHITMDTITTLDDEKLRSLGVFEIGLRENILREIEELYIQRKKVDLPTSDEEHPPPTAPVEQSTSQDPDVVQPTAPSESQEEENECVVCLDRNSDTIFLPCGHVCACFICSTQLQSCPMCRSDVAQKIKIFRS
uniref:Zinc finger protein n=1 Tax=Ciona intestinalis TaxID=7719 RepID=Q1RPV6_CIOIN|nr:zinc finger protein [Ciona intestinalis]BAE93329.1 zinc finger protein [Ciona intestinalis]|eukprot:NP_001071929.1 zinc finger protein [Ciona intestinalis]